MGADHRLLRAALGAGEGDVPAADATADRPELERLSEALDELAAVDPALAQLVDLHFFCGFSLAEVAAMRDVSPRTVQRDWNKARLILHDVLRGAP